MRGQLIVFWATPAAGALIALSGVLVSVFVTSFLNHRSRKWRLADEHRMRLIQRGEEVYSLLKKWNDANRTWFLQSRLAMRGEIDYNQYLDIYIESAKDIDIKVERIDLIFAAYIPHLKDNWSSCVRLVQTGSSIESEFKNDYKSGVFSGDEKLPQLQKAVLDAHHEIDQLLMHVAEFVGSASSKN